MTFWIIFGQSLWTIRDFPNINVFDLFDMYSDTSMMLILSWHLALDTFFLISGFLLSFSSFNKNSQMNFKSNTYVFSKNHKIDYISIGILEDS